LTRFPEVMAKLFPLPPSLELYPGTCSRRWTIYSGINASPTRVSFDSNSATSARRGNEVVRKMVRRSGAADGRYRKGNEWVGDSVGRRHELTGQVKLTPHHSGTNPIQHLLDAEKLRLEPLVRKVRPNNAGPNMVCVTRAQGRDRLLDVHPKETSCLAQQCLSCNRRNWPGHCLA
jgi:hypothetical protein